MEPKFKHLCPEWDFMKIDERNREFGACLCYSENPEAKAIRNKINDEIEEFYTKKTEDILIEIAENNRFDL